MPRSFSLATVLLVASIVRAGPTTRPDLSDPKKTYHALAAAYAAGDSKAVQACYYAKNDVEKKSIAALADFGTAYLNFKAAVKAKFGANGENLVENDRVPLGPEADALRRVDAGKIEYHGDMAVLTVDAPEEFKELIKTQRATFHKTPEGWKIDFSSSPFHDDSAEVRDAFTQAYAKNAATYNRLLAEVNSGKFPTLEALEKRLDEE